jgi:type I restriction enzyme S subunit
MYNALYRPDKNCLFYITGKHKGKRMKSKWRKVRLGEVVEVIGGGTPSTSHAEYWNGDISWITPKDLTGYTNTYINKGERNISQEGLKNSSARILPKGTVLLTTRAPIGYVAIASSELCTNQGFKSFVVDNKRLHNLFLYYWLKGHTEYLQSMGTGTTFMEIPGKRAKEIEIILPPLPTQRTVAAILSCLDDKIALNHRINANLEAQAQGIFKNWFLDFEPWGGVMPKDWQEGTLGYIASITSGKRPSCRQAAVSAEADIPLIGASSIMGYTNASLYNEKILIAGRVGTHGVIQRYSRPCWPSDNTLVIKSEFYEFTYQKLRGVNFHNMNRGSTQPLITQTDLRNVPILLPDLATVREFEELVGSLMNKNERSIQESECLAAIRDTLLPKLMSGEIEVKL